MDYIYVPCFAATRQQNKSTDDALIWCFVYAHHLGCHYPAAVEDSLRDFKHECPAAIQDAERLRVFNNKARLPSEVCARDFNRLKVSHERKSQNFSRRGSRWGRKRNRNRHPLVYRSGVKMRHDFEPYQQGPRRRH